MHGHDHNHGEGDSLRPKAARLEERDDPTLWRAAAERRPDVLGPEGLLSMQRLVGNRRVQRVVGEERSPVLDVLSSSAGSPLEEPVRADMEARLGQDFSDVRVHTGDAAHESARSVNAHAYTVGNNVVFQRGSYDPASSQGQTMLAHELTHVVQQRNGPVDGTPTGDGVRVSDPSDGFEREAAATAERAMSEPPQHVHVPTAPTNAAGVQRQASEEEEDVQGAFIQRSAMADQQPTRQPPVQRVSEEPEEEAPA